MPRGVETAITRETEVNNYPILIGITLQLRGSLPINIVFPVFSMVRKSVNRHGFTGIAHSEFEGKGLFCGDGQRSSALWISALSSPTDIPRTTMNSTNLQQFEAQLEQFEYACNHGATLPDLRESLRTALASIADVKFVTAAITEPGGLRSIGCELSETDRKELAVALESADPWQSEDRPILIDSRMLLVRELFHEHKLILLFSMAQDPQENSLLPDAAGALADCMAVAVNRELASMLHQQLLERDRADSFVRAVYRCDTPEECAHAIADHSSGLLSNGRVSVVAMEADQCRVMAVTGVRTADRAADTVQRIEQFVGDAIRLRLTNRWIESAAHNSVPEISQQLSWFAINGIHTIRVESLHSATENKSVAPRVYVVIELFEGQPWPQESLVEFLMTKSGSAICAFSELKSVAATGKVFGIANRKVIIFAILVVCLLALSPADFEVEVRGQVFPVERFRIFAPDDGIVDSLEVNADDTVVAGQFLLRLENAERELERSRLLGEIESVSVRIQAVRATRTSSGASSESRGPRGVDLSSEEQQLEQKLASLNAERLLLDEQINSLSLHSPIAGAVYQRRLKERLESRPVQRGQQLMEIVNTTGDWQLELQIPEDAAGYVRDAASAAQKANAEFAGSKSNQMQPGQPVRFWLNSQKSHVSRSTLDSLEMSAHIDEQRLTCLATASCRDIDTTHLRPGQSVSARIGCGRRALGFVWFREVIEYLQKKRFAWL